MGDDIETYKWDSFAFAVNGGEIFYAGREIEVIGKLDELPEDLIGHASGSGYKQIVGTGKGLNGGMKTSGGSLACKIDSYDYGHTESDGKDGQQRSNGLPPERPRSGQRRAAASLGWVHSAVAHANNSVCGGGTLGAVRRHYDGDSKLMCAVTQKLEDKSPVVVSRLPVGSSASSSLGLSDKRTGDGDALLLAAG